MREEFGKTWWGKKFLQALDDIDYSNRLPRGKRYARNGSVESVKLDGQSIQAKVRGSKLYKVQIVHPPFKPGAYKEFLKLIATKPTLVSKLMNQELDPEISELAEESKLNLFPKKWTDLKMSCSCPDWAVPCKHLAAVVYKFTSEVDNNPFLLFEMRNATLYEDLKKYGIHVESESVEIPRFKDWKKEISLGGDSMVKEGLQAKENSQAKGNPKVTENMNLSEINPYTKLDYKSIPNIGDSLLGFLKDSPAFYPGNQDFKQMYAQQFRKLQTHAGRILQNGLDDAEDAKDLSRSNGKSSSQSRSPDMKELLSEMLRIHPWQLPDYQASVAITHTGIFLALHILANGCVTPRILETTKGQYRILWTVTNLSKPLNRVLEIWNSMTRSFTSDGNYGKTASRAVQWIYNENKDGYLLTGIINSLIPILYYDSKYTNPDPLVEFFFDDIEREFKDPGTSSQPKGIAGWLQAYHLTKGDYIPQVEVDETSPGRFSVQISMETKKKGEIPIPLEKVLREKQFEKEKMPILGSLSILEEIIPGLKYYINSQAEERIEYNSKDFTEFFMERIPSLELLGIPVLLPRSLQNLIRPKTTIKLKSRKATGKTGKSFLSTKDLFSFEPTIALGENFISPRELEKLFKTSGNLIYYKSRYILIEPGELEKLKKLMKGEGRSGRSALNQAELLQAAVSGEFNGEKIATTPDVKKLIEAITNIKDEKVPATVSATLRPYQERGYAWLVKNTELGFGSVLADDMGLGKTLQTIALITKFHTRGILKKKPALVTVPTGLLSNWENEIRKFSPKLRVFTFHGQARKWEKPGSYDVLLTSYGILRSSTEEFSSKKWSLFVIDEAQNIKNVSTAQTQAVKSIQADHCIALSGTPVENRLSELWSIFDFANPGYLGSAKEFKTKFSVPIEIDNDESIANHLKKVTAPFLMRRGKTDKSIISDLPEKIEKDSYASLTKNQAVLYQKTLEKAMEDIESMKGNDSKTLFKRTGLILQMILALKQICNHPALYLKNRKNDPALSGKVELLFGILDSIIDAGEKVLIFSQFTEMGKLLETYLEERYEGKPLFLHGGLSVPQRKRMVEDFQTNPASKIFLLSLKAGGTGLNLTTANHVIHYDLWWNPAVEAQATDRAFRIGQKKNVMVHRFITKATFEEKINAMIQSKKKLANMTVSTGENWIGNLSNKELKEIFS